MNPLAISLLVCLSAVCIDWSDAGSYSHDHHPLLMTCSQKLLQPHKILKRQNSDQEGICTVILANVTCTSGFNQEYAELAQRCNEPEAAELIRRACGLNSNGDICNSFGNDNTRTFTTNAGRACSTTPCSSECRSLLTNARNDIGCCIPLFNSSSSPVYNYSLWSACGVETVTQDCTDATFDLKPMPVDPTCTEDVLNARLLSIFCRREYAEELRERLSEREECNNFINDGENNVCLANRFGTYCDLLSDELLQNFTEASLSCTNTSTCEPRCIETLNNITNTVGCCFNDRYNASSTSPIDFLSYEFWSRCNLNSPGRCEEFLNDAATITKASSIAVTSAVALVLMLFK